MPRYNPAAWYWAVANRAAPNTIFSAPAGGYVATSDAGYQAFVAGAGAATAIPSDGELADVLTKAGVSAALVGAAMGAAPSWNAVASGDICAAVVAAGCRIQSTANASLDATYPLDQASLADITAIAAGINAGKALPGGGSTFNLIDAAGNPHAIGASDFLNLAAALESYIYDCTVTKLALLGGHSASWPTQPVAIA